MASNSVERETQLWRAVLGRDPRMDDKFVYAVRSTGVYCLPSCPSRRPRRAQVEFFQSAAQAQQFGYRPCRRCWVQQDARKARAEAVSELCRVLNHETDPRRVPEMMRTLAATVGMSAGRLRQMFRELTGVSPGAYLDQARLQRFKNHVRKEDVTTAMHESGYGSSSRLYERSISDWA